MHSRFFYRFQVSPGQLSMYRKYLMRFRSDNAVLRVLRWILDGAFLVHFCRNDRCRLYICIMNWSDRTFLFSEFFCFRKLHSSFNSAFSQEQFCFFFSYFDVDMATGIFIFLCQERKQTLPKLKNRGNWFILLSKYLVVRGKFSPYQSYIMTIFGTPCNNFLKFEIYKLLSDIGALGYP